MNDLKIVIDAGHGGTDPGAVANGVQEKDLTLMIAKYMYDRFREAGIEATLIRSTDETISPEERVRRILAAYGNDPNVIVISNHINSNATGTSEGAEVIYALRNNDTLARNILTELGREGQIMRTVYQRRLPSDPSKDYYFIHRNTGVTQPVIVEYGFINNAADLNRIQNNYRNYVDGVIRAVLETTSHAPSTGNTYTVKSGDTLWNIAQRYDTTVDDIMDLNGLTSTTLTIGQVLRIPQSSIPTIPGTENTYTVVNGDTLWSIAQRYHTSVDAIMNLNGLTSTVLTIGQVLNIPNNSSSSTTSPTPPIANTHIVQPGDTLWSIAQMHNTTVETLRRLNNLSNNILSIGQVITLPKEQMEYTMTYIVKQGDTLWNLAQRFNTTLETLRRLNNIYSDVLSVGQILIVPNVSTNYTVQKGDTLWKIAQKFNLSVDMIKKLNNLHNDMIMPGQLLIINKMI